MHSAYTLSTRLLAAGFLLALSLGASAQQPTPPPIAPRTNQPSILPIPDTQQSDLPSDLAERQAKLMNDSRQKQLILDTRRLLALANELKTAVDKSNKDTLSLDVIRKAEEIEKLAHSVKEKMKGS
ncbi:MAG TPA: hypothetical protein VGU46_08140 [Acidobacteriaceae bacterium]|nr:hypothetical protein [Acidobacteriaceae bacterium]